MKQLLAFAATFAVLQPVTGLGAVSGAGGAVTAAAAAGAAVRSVSVVPDAGRTQVVIGYDASVDIDDFTLESPYRIVVDLNGATLRMAPRYDRMPRGGVTNVRAGQHKPNVVRVVVEMDGPHPYEVLHRNGQIVIVISGSEAEFTSWHSSPDAAGSVTTQSASARVPVDDYPAAQRSTPVEANIALTGYGAATPEQLRLSAASIASQQPRITVTYQDADIRDVIAAFATFSGRTIVVGKDVGGTVTAEIKNQPWDVALRAILQGQGLAAAEDAVTGIIAVDSYANIATKQSTEPLITQLVAVNYARASSLVPTLQHLLAKECVPGGVPQAPQNAQTSCFSRGAVAADTGTNTLLITETPTRMNDLLSYVRSLDIRTPQVAIKAKIIFVNRTSIEELGLSYDLGTGSDQFFSQLAPRVDPTTRVPVDTDGDGVPDAFGGGSPITGDRILLGGNALSAIANANARVVNPALRLVYSATIGKFQLTAFLDALQEIRLADLQAEPSIVTLDNRQAEILVGQEIPIRVLDHGSQGQQQVAGGQGGFNVPRATVQLKEVGIILNVTPQVTNNRQILLRLHAENSDAQLASSDVGFIFGKQRADNQLLVNDGETAVIGGLTVTQVTTSRAGIPLLVDLPIIGRLFGTTRTSEEKRDLLILVTPHIIDEGERAMSARPPQAGGR